MGLGPPPLTANGGGGTSTIVDPEAGKVGGVHETVPQFIELHTMRPDKSREAFTMTPTWWDVRFFLWPYIYLRA
jgi:hypothetical protein